MAGSRMGPHTSLAKLVELVAEFYGICMFMLADLLPAHKSGVGWGSNVHSLAHFYDVTPRHVHLHLRTYILEKASARVKEKNLS